MATLVKFSDGSSFMTYSKERQNETFNIISQKIWDEKTPFFIACENNHLEIIKFIHSIAKKQHTIKCYDYTPFYVACEYGYVKIIEFIHSINNMIRDINNSPPLITYAEYMKTPDKEQVDTLE